MRLVVWSVLMVMIVLRSGTAGGAEDVGAALQTCHAEADDASRLACYDRVTSRPPAPSAAATAAAATAVARPVDDFGRERQLAHEQDRKRTEATRAIGELRAAIVGIETRMDGLMTFTLDNAQVWRQVRPDSKFRIKQGDEVLIQPGALGSFILSGPTKKSTRVTRVK